MKILFIGNSYTYFNALPDLIGGLARENGKAMRYDAVLCGGRKLYEYLDKPDHFTDEVKAAAGEQWDVVFLQEQSYLALSDPAAFEDGVGRLQKLLEKADRFVLYQTWGRREGEKLLLEKGWTNQSMTDGLEKAYQKAAMTFGMDVSPVGRRFQEVRKACPEADLYYHDGSHPSYLGSCLAAVTHYETLFGERPERILSLGLSEKDRKILGYE